VPSEDEWQTFEFNLGMDPSEPMNGWRGDADNVGGKMKSTDLWNAPNSGATNESGFTGLPGGYRSHSNGSYLFSGMLSYWWSSTGSETNAWSRGLSHNIGAVHRINGNVGAGYYVRCIKD
jgi:uncharacterized protein (TIGR02145 family)